MPVPLYRYSFREAKEHDEIQEWKQSHAENIRCRDAIDKMVSERYSNNIMPNNIIKDACAEFGIDRVGSSPMSRTNSMICKEPSATTARMP